MLQHIRIALMENFVVIMESVYHHVGFVMVKVTAKIDLMKSIAQVQGLHLLAHVSENAEVLAEYSSDLIVLR